MIKEHRDNESKGVYHKEDLLYTLLQAQDTEAGIGRMTDLQLKDEVMTIFLAGRETTSNALTWTFYLLSQHTTADDRLYAELSSVLGVCVPAGSKQKSGIFGFPLLGLLLIYFIIIIIFILKV